MIQEDRSAQDVEVDEFVLVEPKDLDSWDDLDTGDGRNKESSRKTALIQELRLRDPPGG